MRTGCVSEEAEKTDEWKTPQTSKEGGACTSSQARHPTNRNALAVFILGEFQSSRRRKVHDRKTCQVGTCSITAHALRESENVNCHRSRLFLTRLRAEQRCLGDV
ncbi:hypothetical protein BE221DRAFT_62854 [Ostreococcus tauri]|uniref:Uncharacterized protein n=1 Tax=Ostreococcus tauri TaxID=70448 RepID=A0A1Y5HYV1_OSTTA|nr:hypothetical protein BE221DRAFT_62854 [Ostreococcus tauri]